MPTKLTPRRAEAATHYAKQLEHRIQQGEKMRAELVAYLADCQNDLDHFQILCGRYALPNGLTVQALGVRLDRLIGDPGDD